MTTLHRALLLATSSLTMSISAQAQTYYVDCGSNGSTSAPSSAFGAAYGVPGVWNAIPLVGGFHPLVDATGASGPVTAYVEDDCDWSSCDAPELSGDEAALLEDWWNGDCYASPNVIGLQGLAAGNYQLFVFGYNACTTSVTVSIEVTAGGSTELLACGGAPFPGSWYEFPIGRTAFTHAEGGEVTLRIFSSGYGGLAGFQLVRLGEDPVPYCFGHLGDCPCEPGVAGNGCPSSFNAAGANVEGSGRAKLGADTLVLTATGISSSVATFLQGDALLADGFGVPFGDGLRCAGGQIVRLASKPAPGGVAVYPEAGELPISIRGLIPPGGGFRGYQVWYRNPASHCTSGTFNFTNAVAVDWH